MGGAVSSGRDNAELIDNLTKNNYIRTPRVEAAFRAVDRGDFIPDASRFQAYRDLAWKQGPLHLSAPCIYSEVMEALELKEGASFLNVGSGTGYISTIAGLLLGERGINHGIELHPQVLLYANEHLAEFMNTSSAMDEFDFCTPVFIQGNGLCLGAVRYDRVYCGGACPVEFTNYFQLLLNVGGILVMPLNDDLIQVRRVSETEWKKKSVLSVSFAPLQRPSAATPLATLSPPELAITPSPLQVLARGAIRRRVRRVLLASHAEMREPPPRAACSSPRAACRFVVPVGDDSDLELDELHDIEERASGSAEMNALLSLVLSMSHSRASGALRLPRDDSDRDSLYSDEEPPPDTGGGENSEPRRERPARRASDSASNDERYCRKTPVDYSSDHHASSCQRGGGKANKRNSHEINQDEKEGSSTQSSSEQPKFSEERNRQERHILSNGIVIVEDLNAPGTLETAERASKMDEGTPVVVVARDRAVEWGAAARHGSTDQRAEVEGRGTADSGFGLAHSSGSDAGDDATVQRRRRWRKRLRSSSSGGGKRRAAARKRPRRPDLHRARRDAIALRMRAAVHALPLPLRLRRYVDLDRP